MIILKLQNNMIILRLPKYHNSCRYSYTVQSKENIGHFLYTVKRPEKGSLFFIVESGV